MDRQRLVVKQYDPLALSSYQRDKIFSAAERWKDLSSPGLLPYVDVRPEENQVVMEWMEQSIATRLRNGASDPRDVLKILRGALAALCELHEQGWLHLNLKPSNVFLESSGRVKLSDGWLLPSSQPGTLPKSSDHKYVSPEHTDSASGPIGAASDLYVAGFLALELLAGERFGRAFQGVSDDAATNDPAWLRWHASAMSAPPATSFAKACPHDFATCIVRLTAKNLRSRFHSAREALNALPQEIGAPAGGSECKPGPAPKRAGKHEALATHVLERPSTSIVLAIASGARAGEMVGTDDTELFIGFDQDCLLQFTADEDTDASIKLLLRRGPEGWYAVRVAGEMIFINQRQLDERLILRSGDVIRLTPFGPDIQFAMQSGGVTPRTLADRFLPAQAVQPTRPTAPLGVAADRESAERADSGRGNRPSKARAAARSQLASNASGQTDSGPKPSSSIERKRSSAAQVARQARSQRGSIRSDRSRSDSKRAHQFSKEKRGMPGKLPVVALIIVGLIVLVIFLASVTDNFNLF